MSEHVVTPVKTYVFVFVGLLVGTLLTVLASEADFGWANNIVAMAIAIIKACSCSTSSWSCATARG